MEEDEVKVPEEADEVKTEDADAQAAFEAQAVEDAAAAELEAQEAEDFELARRLAAEEKPPASVPTAAAGGAEEAQLIVEVSCATDVALDPPTLLEIDTTALFVVVAVSSAAGAGATTMLAEERTAAVEANLEARTAAWGSGDGTVRFVVPKVADAALCFTLYKRNESAADACEGCCNDSIVAAFGGASGAVAVGGTSPMPVGSKGGEASDWVDGSPRDLFLDSGAVLTVSTTLVRTAPDAAEPPAAAS